MVVGEQSRDRRRGGSTVVHSETIQTTKFKPPSHFHQKTYNTTNPHTSLSGTFSCWKSNWLKNNNNNIGRVLFDLDSDSVGSHQMHLLHAQGTLWNTKWTPLEDCFKGV